MFKSVRTRNNLKQQTEISVAPLIDMVFILLIFFLVTTSFVSETGLFVHRPQASTSDNIEKESLLIGIGPAGQIYIAGQQIGLFSIRPVIENKLKSNPDIAAVLVADNAVSAGLIVQVMDELRLGGVQRIALATQQE